jgi:outer membrane protein assembly factor BamB
LAAASAAATAAASPDASALAREILSATGVKGGLVVHLGCGDGRLTAALRANDSYLVHGLDGDARNVATAREHVRSLGLYGSVSVDQLGGERLPYIDNLVSLLVSEELRGVSMAEVRRVLAPEGVAYTKIGGKWASNAKPRPEGIDEWPHFLHGADGNAVARDDVVGFPYHIQWVGSPTHSRDHELTTSMDVMVSAGGRIFYIMDEGHTAMPYFLPARWRLVARDAFNGVILWKRPLEKWRPHLVKGRKSLAADLWRRLVATRDAVYVTETIFGPVIGLDPATGEMVRRYVGTERTEEIICEDGALYLVATTSEPEDVDRRQLAQRRQEPDQKRLMAVDAGTGAIRWTVEGEETRGVHPVTLAVKGRHLVFQNTEAIICLDSRSGEEIWRFARPSGYARPGYATPTVVIHDDVVLCADKKTGVQALKKGEPNYELIALSAEDGGELWRCDCADNVGASADVFVANSLVWVGESPRRASSDYNTGRDLHTGEVKKTFSHEANWPTMHHHRCYRDKATEKYILAGRTGIEFVDLSSGELTTHHWVRGICEYGIMPCNGLIYSPPDQCGCYIESKLHGFHALAPKRPGPQTSPPPESPSRLQRGPAYGQRISTAESTIRAREDWPTFRHDNSRSGHTRATVPVSLKPLWTRKLGGRLAQPVVAGGRAFVPQPDTHTVFCLDAASGEVLWRYVAGGRVDSPPTVANGLAVFGCRDGSVYALRASDGELVWRFLAAPRDRRLVEIGQVASVWPVSGSVLIENGSVYFAAGRSTYLDGGVYLYKLELATGKPLLVKHYYGRDPQTGEYVSLYTPFDGEVLPDRELPGLLPDILSCDGKNIYMRNVPMNRELVIQDLEYVPHLFGSMGFLEDAWWERTYWIYGSHFYSGARGHGYAKTLYPGGRILVFDDECVYGYREASLGAREQGIFRVDKSPELVDVVARASRPQRRGAEPQQPKAAGSGREDETEYVWKNGIPQDPKAMSLTSGRKPLTDRIRRMTKYELTWRNDAPIHVQGMVLTDERVLIAGSAKFDEQRAQQYLTEAPTDTFRLEPFLQDAVDAFDGKSGGVLWAVSKGAGTRLAETKLPSSPVFDGMIAAGGRLFLSLKDGSVICLGGSR